MEVGDRKQATRSVLVKDSTLIFKIKFKLILEKNVKFQTSIFEMHSSPLVIH